METEVVSVSITMIIAVLASVSTVVITAFTALYRYTLRLSRDKQEMYSDYKEDTAMFTAAYLKGQETMLQFTHSLDSVTESHKDVRQVLQNNTDAVKELVAQHRYVHSGGV